MIKISLVKSELGLVLVALLVIANVAQGAPYYYWFADQAVPEQQAAPEAIQQAADQAKQTANQAQESVGQADQGVQQQLQQQADGQLPQRMKGHLSELYSHGSTAVRGVVDKVQPDIRNIGRDISEAYQATRSEVGKRIEPLAQTVRPYIDQAQKVVAPYVNSAREEVPKLINQAGPALSKVGGSVRDGITGVWSKINGGEGQPQKPQTVQEVQDQIQVAAEKAKQHASNTVQQAPEAGQTPPK